MGPASDPCATAAYAQGVDEVGAEGAEGAVQAQAGLRRG
jgi:hypothetical protein